MLEAVLGLGSNLGARRALLRAALALLAEQPGCRVIARSRLFETPALGPPQPDYLNAAVRVAWVGELEGLFALTCHVEQLLGRERRVRWGPRTLDIDLLHATSGVFRSPALSVPHAELAQRSFALAPLLEVMPELEPRYGPVLAGLGGAPRRARPGWLDDSAEALAWPADVPRDEAELACLGVSAVGACVKSSARARSSLTFAGPALRPDSDPPAWIAERAARLAKLGFYVNCAAITQLDTAATRGLFVGEHTGSTRGPTGG